MLHPDQVRMLYLTLVGPHISFCCIVWDDIDKTLCLDRIHKIQKRYCRLITFSESRAYSAPLFKKLRILNIYNLFRFQASFYMHRNIHGSLPRTFFNFQLNSNIHFHFTRRSENLLNIFSRTGCRQHSFQILGLRIWNTLPREIVNLSFARFRNKIKAYILNSF